MELANTPEPPYYAVIFSSIREDNNSKDYLEMAQRMDELAKVQPGFLGFETARDHLGVSVSYWDSLEAIQNWKNNGEHITAQNKGKKDWYSAYKVRIAKVEREYSFDKS